MATLSKNGTELARMVFTRRMTDGAEADEMACEQRITYSVRSNGITLRKVASLCDFGFGNEPRWIDHGWKRSGKVKAHLMQNTAALVEAMRGWCEGMNAKGWATELSGEIVPLEQLEV